MHTSQLIYFNGKNIILQIIEQFGKSTGSLYKIKYCIFICDLSIKFCFIKPKNCKI